MVLNGPGPVPPSDPGPTLTDKPAALFWREPDRDMVDAESGAAELVVEEAKGAGEFRRELVDDMSRGPGVALSKRRFLRLLVPPATASAATIGTGSDVNPLPINKRQ